MLVVDSVTPESFDVKAGNSLDTPPAGTLTVRLNLETSEICVAFNLVVGWVITKEDIQIEFEESKFPWTRKGNIKVGRLTYHNTYSPAEAQSNPEYCVKWVKLDGAPADVCGRTLLIAAHADVQKYNQAGELIESQTAWASPNPRGKSLGGLTSGVTFVCIEPTTSAPDTTETPHEGCETAWPLVDDNPKVEVITFVAAGVEVSKWGAFVCTSEEGKYSSKFYADQQYYAGTLEWAYMCQFDESCQVVFSYKMVATCKDDPPEESIYEAQARVSIFSSNKYNIMTGDPEQYEYIDGPFSKYKASTGTQFFAQG